jgi:hypothetical protein
VGLFNKYFGDQKSNFNQGKPISIDYIPEYIDLVNYIAKTWFQFDQEKIDYCIPEYFDELDGDDSEKHESERSKYDKEILKLYEPKIISLSILGYYMLKCLKYGEKDANSLIELLENKKEYKSIVLTFVEKVARERRDTFFAILRKEQNTIEIDDLRKRMAIVLTHYIDRFGLYECWLFNGLDSYLKNPDNFDSDSFDKAYWHYLDPSKHWADYYTEDPDFNIENFIYSVYMAYIHLKKTIITH